MNLTSEQTVAELMPQLRESVLDNGMRVVTLDATDASTSDVVAVQIRFLAGSALDGDLPGLAEFMTAMLTRGSAGRTSDTIAIELDSLGAALGVGAGRATIDGSAKALRQVVDDVVGQLAQALRQPDFPEDQINTVRSQKLAALRRSLSSTRAVAGRALTEAMYPAGHPLHHRSGGTQESLAAIDRGALQAFHDRALRPDGAIAVVAGGVDHDGAVALIERHFGDWSGTPPEISIPAVAPPEATVRITSDVPGKTQADLAIGTPAINRSHDDYYALSVANLILGQFGLYGRLGERVREQQGMAYYAYSSFVAGRAVGAWRASAGVSVENIDPAIDSIVDELRRFNDGGPNEQEFEDAIGSVLGSLPLALETSSGRASAAIDIVYNDLGHDYLQQVRGIIQELTAEQITSAAETYLDPDRLVISIAKPAEE